VNYKDEIKLELEKVEERILSKQKLLENSPDDEILILSLKSFEMRKNELLFQLNSQENKTLHQQLEELQKYILENEKLQKKFPEEKDSLEKTLIGLKKLRKQIFKDLNKYYQDHNLSFILFN